MLGIHKYMQCRLFSRTYLLYKSHYDTLGVTPNATMNDIKTAYYNLSLQYHPDKTDGSDRNLDKFRDITEAYEILSNVESKRRYDKGILQQAPLKINRSKPKRQVNVSDTSTATESKRPVFNVESWSRAHYGESIKENQEAKTRFEHHKQLELEVQKSDKLSYFLGIGLVLVGVVSLYDLFASTPLDRPRKTIG